MTSSSKNSPAGGAPSKTQSDSVSPPDAQHADDCGATLDSLVASSGQPSPGTYPIRLQKFLRDAGVDSRRACENVISAGRVKVNGRTVTELGTKVVPALDTVEVDGKTMVWGSPAITLMLNKPAGYVTTMDDPQGRPCVAQLVPTETYPGLFPIGRLDRATTGLLLFSTDGALGHGLLHPSHHVEKTYHAVVAGIPSEEELDVLRTGVMLDDGPAAPATVQLLETMQDAALLSIAIHEGRNRQVRRMCNAIHHEVVQLERVSFGPLELGTLPVGTWRLLDNDEVVAVSRAAGKAC